jgi:hypothetical protein
LPLSTKKQPVLWTAGIVLLFISVGLEFYGRACGFLKTSDSLQYLSAARSFHESWKFLSPDGSYYSYWPPLFPIILSYFKDPEIALIWINITCKIILVWVLLRIARSFIESVTLTIIYLAASLLGVHMAMVSVFIWSELIFMMLIFLNAYCVLRLKDRWSYFYWLLVTGFLACLQRNAGLFWISGVSVWLLTDPSLSLKIRIVQSGVCFLGCTIGMWAWNIYNTFFLPADFSFYKHDFFAYTFSNLKSTLGTYGKMIIPLSGSIGMLIGMLFFLAVLSQWVLKAKVNRNIHFFGIVLMFYSLGFLIMPGRLDFFEMDRYFSVVTPITYLFIMLMVQENIQRVKPVIRVGLYIAVLIWLGYPLTRTYKNIKAWHERSCSGNKANNLSGQ